MALAQAKAPLQDAAAVNTTRWALYEALTATGLPVRCGTGGRTKWNRHRTGAPTSHTLDALHVGELDHVNSWPSRVLIVAATGRGSYCRTRTNTFGFPRLRLLQRADGYTYTAEKEPHLSTPSQRSA